MLVQFPVAGAVCDLLDQLIALEHAPVKDLGDGGGEQRDLRRPDPEVPLPRRLLPRANRAHER